MTRKSWNGKSWNGKNIKSFRVVLTTDDLAELFDTTTEAIKQKISRGAVLLTGDAVKDFRMLCELAD